MPYREGHPKVVCPKCKGKKGERSKTCRACSTPYARTQERRDHMSQVLKGRQQRGTGWKHSEETRAKMRSYWTPERREKKRIASLKNNPSTRYPGLSCRGAKKIRDAAGQCQECGSVESLNVHHVDRDKSNQALSNLLVLCAGCHQRLHSEAEEIGWAAYWAKRRS